MRKNMFGIVFIRIGRKITVYLQSRRRGNERKEFFKGYLLIEEMLWFTFLNFCCRVSIIIVVAVCWRIRIR